MTTKRLATALLLVTSLAIAGQATAQTDPCKPLSKLGNLPELKALSNLGDLAELKALSKLGDLPDLKALSKLGDLPDLKALSKLGDLAELKGLSRLGDDIGAAIDLAPLAALSSLDALSALDNLQDLHRLPRFGNSPRLRGVPGARDRGQARQPRRGPEQTERVTKTFRVGHNGSLDLRNISGDIVVHAGSGDDMVIDATKRVPQGPDAQRQLSVVTVETTERAGRVEVHTHYPEGTGNIRTSVDYDVTVPSGAAVNLHSVSGDIRVTNVKGALRADCISGDIVVENADQIESVKSVSGDVTVTGATGGDVRVGTINGDLVLRNVKGRSLDASSISGDIRLTEVAVEHAGVKTMSGDVEYAGPFARGGRYEFTAHSGDVKLMPTSNTGFEINAETFSGEIRSNMAITMKGAEIPARHVRHEMTGTYGDGSALVTVKTFSGGVTIGKGNGESRARR